MIINLEWTEYSELKHFQTSCTKLFQIFYFVPKCHIIAIFCNLGVINPNENGAGKLVENMLSLSREPADRF